MSLLGLDIGTTGAKCVGFDERGNVLASAYREYPLYHPRPGWAELDCNEVWSACEEVTGKVAARLAADPPKAIAVSTQGEAGMLVDEEGNALTRSAVSFDARTVEEKAELVAALGAPRLYEIAGRLVHTIHTVTKIMWTRRHHPELYDKAWKFLCFEDYAALRLAGQPAMDWSLAGTTLLFDVRKREWSDEILDASGIDEEFLARAVAPGAKSGAGARSAAERRGLPAGMAIVAGAHDQPGAALGAGVIEPGIAIDSTGTVACITAALAGPVINEKMLASGLCCYSHAARDLYATIAYNFTGGSILKWYRDTLGAAERAEAEAKGCSPYEVMMEEAGTVDGPTSLLVLPYFSTTGTPYFDENAKSAVLGIRQSTSRGELLKALVEGVNFEMRLNLELLDGAGVKVRALRSYGGGAKSDTLMQIKADVYGRPVSRLGASEAGCLGMAMLGGVAVGEYTDLAEAVEATVKIERTFEPDAARSAAYTERFGLYREVYPTFKDLAHRM